MIILLLHLSYLGSGLLVLHLLRWADDLSFPFKLLTSYLFGLLTHVIILYMAFSIGLTTHLIPVLLLVGGLGALAVIIYIGLTSTKRVIFIKPKPNLSWLSNGLLILTICPPLFLITIVLTQVPEISYDAVAIWGNKAVNFYHGNHFWSEAFTDIRRVHPHKGYPCFLPLMMYEHYALIGTVDDIFFKIGLWIFYILGLTHYYIFLREWIGSVGALLAVGILLYMPMMSYSPIQGAISDGYADFPLALMILCSVGYGVRYFAHRRRGDLAGSMIAITSALLLKDEGMAWFVVFFACFGLGLFARRYFPDRSEIAMIVFPFSVLIPFLVIHSFLPHSTDIKIPSSNEILAIRESLPTVLCVWVKSLFNEKVWGVLPPVIVVSYIFGLARNLSNRRNIIAWSALLQFCVILMVMSLFDVQLHRLNYYVNHTYDRLVIHILPLTIYLAIVMNSPSYINVRDSYQEDQ